MSLREAERVHVFHPLKWMLIDDPSRSGDAGLADFSMTGAKIRHASTVLRLSPPATRVRLLWQAFPGAATLEFDAKVVWSNIQHAGLEWHGLTLRPQKVLRALWSMHLGDHKKKSAP